MVAMHRLLLLLLLLLLMLLSLLERFSVRLLRCLPLVRIDRCDDVLQLTEPFCDVGQEAGQHCNALQRRCSGSGRSGRGSRLMTA